MCRSIRVLRNPEHPAAPEELSAAALQYVRKISGFRKPSKANEAAFDQAVREITASSARLLGAIESRPVAAANLTRHDHSIVKKLDA